MLFVGSMRQTSTIFLPHTEKKSSTDAVTALCYTLVTGQERERERGIQRTFILLVLNPWLGIQSALLFVGKFC